MTRFSDDNYELINDLFISPDINIDITEDCNLRCSYCYIKENHSERVLKEETAKQLIDLWLKNSQPSVNKKQELSFWGGESLLEWDLMTSLVKYAQSKKEDLNIFTVSNGVLYTPDKVDWCLENNFSVAVSFDGIKDSHDVHRVFPDGAGSWDTINDNLKYAGEVNKRQVVFSTITPEFAPHLFEGLKHCVDVLGITYIIYVPVLDVPWTKEDFNILEEQAIKSIEYVKNHSKKIIINPFNNKNIYETRVNPCRAGNAVTTWSVDGVCFPCPRFNKYGLDFEEKKALEYAFGYIENGEYIKLNNKRSEFVNFKTFERPQCNKCEIYGSSVCNGGCYYVNYKMTDSIHGINKAQCNYKRMIYRLNQQ